MEKLNENKTASADAATEQKVKVVIMGDGPAPAFLREAFPDAEFVDTSAPVPAPDEPPLPTPRELVGLLDDLFAKLRGAECPHHKPVLKEPVDDGKVSEEALRKRAFAALTEVAIQYGVGFYPHELDALFRLSIAFSSGFAIEVAHKACRDYLESVGG